MSTQAPVSIKDSVGDALRFSRENWRFTMIVAGFGAAAIVTSMMLGPLMLVVAPVALIVCHTALVLAALYGVPHVRPRLTADALRVGAAMAIVGLIIAILVIATAYIAMSVLLGPYAEQARAAGEDRAAIEALTRQAIEAQPHVATWAVGIAGLMIFVVTSLLFLGAPASADRKRVLLLETVRWSRANVLRIMGARLLLLLPAFILVGAVQSLLSAALGFSANDPAALMAQASANPALFMLFFAAAVFVQLALYAALEAGLSVALYRRLAPPAA